MVSKPTGRPMGRPTKYSDEAAERIARHLRYGLTKQRACDLEGISRDTLLDWEHRYPAFSELLVKAHSEFVALNALVLQKAARKNGDVRAAMWLLERRGGEEWLPARQRVEVTLDVSDLPDEELARLAGQEPAALPDLSRAG